jgi:glycerol-3-phosphate O-acyltransferase
MLERSIVDKFHTYSTMLSSHILSFTAFEMMRKKFPDLDLYAFLRLPNEDLELKYDDFVRNLENVRNQVFELEKNGKIRVAEELRLPIKELIENGISNMGVYHPQKVLRLNEQGNIVTEDKKLLYYYRNRSEGYQLEAHVR